MGIDIPIPELRRQDLENRQNSIDNIPEEIKIKFNQNDGITTNQELDSSILTLLNNFNKKEYTYFFNSCFNNLNTDKNVYKINKNNIELKCEYKGLDTLSIFFVNDNIFSINGILKRE